MAVVHATEVHAPRLELVGHAQQVLGGVDHVVRDPERARPDVGGAAGQRGERRAGAHEAVGRLVHGAVAAEGHDHVVALDRRLAADLGRVAALLRVDRLDRVARAERVDHEVAQPVRHRRGVRVDDDEHASLGRAVGEQALGQTLRALEGSIGGHEVINTSSKLGYSGSRCPIGTASAAVLASTARARASGATTARSARDGCRPRATWAQAASNRLSPSSLTFRANGQAPTDFIPRTREEPTARAVYEPAALCTPRRGRASPRVAMCPPSALEWGEP